MDPFFSRYSCPTEPSVKAIDVTINSCLVVKKYRFRRPVSYPINYFAFLYQLEILMKTKPPHGLHSGFLIPHQLLLFHFLVLDVQI